MKNKSNFDIEWKNIRVEVKLDTHSFRDLRSTILDLASWLADHPEKRALIVLSDSRITDKRLQYERLRAERAIRPDIMSRLTISLFTRGRYIGLPKDMEDDFVVLLNNRLSNKSLKYKHRDSYYDILQILLNHWLLGKGPVTRTDLGDMAGCSYPTVAAALRRLGPYLSKKHYRRVELKQFPREEWGRMLAVSDHFRETTRFVIRSNDVLPIENYISRLVKMRIDDLAIGGVLGAKHYYHDLDITGAPRLDLSLHRFGKKTDLGFISKLDPALQPIENTLQPPSVVVHVVFRKKSFFTPRLEGLYWADQVECLMDLYEAHMDQQANDFLLALESERIGKE